MRTDIPFFIEDECLLIYPRRERGFHDAMFLESNWMLFRKLLSKFKYFSSLWQLLVETYGAVMHCSDEMVLRDLLALNLLNQRAC